MINTNHQFVQNMHGFPLNWLVTNTNKIILSYEHPSLLRTYLLTYNFFTLDGREISDLKLFKKKKKKNGVFLNELPQIWCVVFSLLSHIFFWGRKRKGGNLLCLILKSKSQSLQTVIKGPANAHSDQIPRGVFLDSWCVLYAFRQTLLLHSCFALVYPFLIPTPGRKKICPFK